MTHGGSGFSHSRHGDIKGRDTNRDQVRDPEDVNGSTGGTKDGDSREKPDEVHAIKSGEEEHISRKCSINNGHPMDLSTDDTAVSQFILLNSRSLSPSASGSCQWKLEYPKSFLTHPQVPVLAAALTETWFREEHTEAQVAVEGYTLICSDRPSRKGGGCALYLNAALTPSDEISWSNQSSNMVAVYIADVHVVMYTLQMSMW